MEIHSELKIQTSLLVQETHEPQVGVWKTEYLEKAAMHFSLGCAFGHSRRCQKPFGLIQYSSSAHLLLFHPSALGEVVPSRAAVK